MAGKAWRARMEGRDLTIHGKENWRVHERGRNKGVHGRGRNGERECSVRVGKDWRAHGKGEGRDEGPMEGLWRSWRKGDWIVHGQGGLLSSVKWSGLKDQ